MSTLALYESMAAVSTAMVATAKANDWERLVTLESQLAALRDEIIRTSDAAHEVFSAVATARKTELIAAMLENDAEIRKHVEPWRKSVERLLSALEQR